MYSKTKLKVSFAVDPLRRAYKSFPPAAGEQTNADYLVSLLANFYARGTERGSIFKKKSAGRISSRFIAHQDINIQSVINLVAEGERMKTVAHGTQNSDMTSRPEQQTCLLLTKC